ncbi:STAS domain-containing protein [Streptomyces sp. NPDC002250]|uniref:STAS domain-containing protein n=1 Tax=Streptomyces sp. NPDC002250 TaxID=3364641 RepID=UPI0036A5A7E9
MMGDCTVEMTASNDGVVGLVRGEMDHESRSALTEDLNRLITRSARVIVLELSEVTFCDSSGLNVLLLARLRANEHGAELALARVPQHLLRMLEMTGISQVLSVYDTPAEAEAALSR